MSSRLRIIRAALISALALGLAPVVARAADSTPVKTAHLTAQLVSQTQAAAPGSTLYVALHQKIMPGWHTYWRNPGDAGEATSVKWTLPQGWSAGAIVWPTPELGRTGPLASYVYTDEVYLPIPIEVPGSAQPGAPVTLKGHADFLVCKDICIPESADLSLTIPVTAGSAAPDPKFGGAVTRTLAAAPKPAGLKAVFQGAADKVTLSVSGDALKGAKAAGAFFFPYDGSAIEHAKPELVQAGPEGLTFTLAPGFAFQHGAPKSLDGVVSLGDGRAYEISGTPGGPLPGTGGSSPPQPSTPSGGHGASPASAGAGSAAASSAGGLLLQAGAAFLGGLLLNLMPCVFPILAMKAAALARHIETPAHARADAVAYTVGVVGSFLLLAGVLLAIRAAGQGVGWGFQLQSPLVVAVLALVVFAAALNLSGLFEAGLSLQGAGGATARGGAGALGSVFTGVLAVVVAAPCTAPFMAPAIGWALVQPPLAALTVFLFLGLGLAAPFLLLGLAPGLARLLPKPGGWMEGFRHLLAFPMYGASAWLAWVFATQTGPNGLPFLFAAAIAVAFGAWIWGVGQRREAATGAAAWALRAVAAVAVLLAIPAVVQGGAISGGAPAASASAPAAGGSLPEEPWSPARVAELQAQGKPVFVDFTAAWCITCQVNEKTVLATKAVTDAFARTGAVYLKADWTRRDATIAQALAAQGRSGVPLYLVYGKGPTPQILPQLLTEGGVTAALEAAKTG